MTLTGGRAVCLLLHALYLRVQVLYHAKWFLERLNYFTPNVGRRGGTGTLPGRRVVAPPRPKKKKKRRCIDQINGTHTRRKRVQNCGCQHAALPVKTRIVNLALIKLSKPNHAHTKTYRILTLLGCATLPWKTNPCYKNVSIKKNNNEKKTPYRSRRTNRIHVRYNAIFLGGGGGRYIF